MTESDSKKNAEVSIQDSLAEALRKAAPGGMINVESAIAVASRVLTQGSGKKANAIEESEPTPANKEKGRLVEVDQELVDFVQEIQRQSPETDTNFRRRVTKIIRLVNEAKTTSEQGWPLEFGREPQKGVFELVGGAVTVPEKVVDGKRVPDEDHIIVSYLPSEAVLSLKGEEPSYTFIGMRKPEEGGYISLESLRKIMKGLEVTEEADGRVKTKNPTLKTSRDEYGNKISFQYPASSPKFSVHIEVANSSSEGVPFSREGTTTEITPDQYFNFGGGGTQRPKIEAVSRFTVKRIKEEKKPTKLEKNIESGRDTPGVL